MKIAMIGQKGMPAIHGGVERHVHELAIRLVKFGLEVVVYSRKWYTKSEDGFFENVFIKHIPSIHTKHLDTITNSLIATIHAIINKVDIIHYHGVGPSLVSWIPRVFAPHIRVITTFHSIDRKHEKWNWFARLVLRMSEWTACKFAHETVVVSRTIEQYSRDAYDKSTVYIPNGVPIFSNICKTDKLSQWALEPKKYILMVSRLIPHKGAHYLIEAFQRLSKEQPELIKDKKLVIVGDGHYTDDYVAQLKQFAQTNSNIVFTSFQNSEALNQLFSNALLMVHPSDNEGLPITVLEGMSHELPILLSDIPEHRELVNNPDYLFNHSNVNSLTEQLARLLRNSNEELADQGKKNKEKIRNEYDWDSIVIDVLNVYQKKNPKELPQAISLGE